MGAASLSGSDQAGWNGKEVRFRAGCELREARERLGWDLGEVAAALRIKLAYLQAIEDGRVSALPGNAYALGFLRTYATTLGLDADEVARRFRAEAQDVNRKTELAFPAPVPERGVPTGAVLLLGLVIVCVGYAGWYRFSDHERAVTHTVPAVPEQLLAAPKAAPVSPQVASVMPPAGSIPTPAPEETPRALPSPADAASSIRAPIASAPTSAAVQGEHPSSQAPPTTAPAPPASAQPASPAPQATTSATAPAENGLVLHASAPTWVQVRASDERVLWDHVMQAGESWTVPAGESGLTLTTGNAGGLGISDNGVALGGLGRAGAVRRGIPLTEAGVKDAVEAAGASAPTVSAPTPARPAMPRMIHHPTSASSTSDLTADQLNARQLERSAQTH